MITLYTNTNAKTMEETGFRIKVSDLLANPWSTDIIDFQWKKSTQLPEITKEWISGKIKLQSINKDTILATIQDANAYIITDCEICGQEFTMNINVENFETKFVAPNIHHDLTETVHDEEFIINMKDDTIDIQDFLVQAIQTNIPIIYKCADCANEELPYEDAEDIENSSSIGNSIKWV